MNNRKKRAVKYVTRYGAALCTLSLAPHASAAIIDLSGNLPGPLTHSFFAATSFDLLGNGGDDFRQLNDSTGKSIYTAGGLSGLGVFPSSSTITVGKVFAASLFFGYAQTGTLTIGFVTGANQVGWIKINFGGFQWPVTFLGAAFNNTPGGTIHAGTLSETANGPTPPTVPEPSTTVLTGLALLALGAAGVRRRRKLQAARNS